MMEFKELHSKNKLYSPQSLIDNRELVSASHYLNIVSVVEARDTLHQVRGWVVAKVRADVTHTESTLGLLQLLWVIIRRFV